jgi:transposase-like protein
LGALGKDSYYRKQEIHKMLVANTEKIVNMYKNEKKRIPSIAEEFGVCPATIYYLLVRNNAINHRKKRSSSPMYPKERKRETNLRPFIERISPELQIMLLKNSEINNRFIKRYDIDTHEKEENKMVDSVVEMKEMILQPKVTKR